MIQEYIAYLTGIRGYSEHTARAYEHDVREFARWLNSQYVNARWSLTTREDVDSYIIELQRRGLKPATTNRALASISGLFDWLKRCGKEVTNPCRFESRRKEAKALPPTIARGELKEAYEHAHGVAKTMLGILMTTGMRIQELLNMTWECIDFEQSCITVSGKGMKERRVYSTPSALETLKTVYSSSPQRGLIFKMEQRRARRMIWEVLKGHCKAKQLSPHAIRHTVATEMAAQGVNATTIAKVLGHESIKTTQKYIDMTQQEVKAAFTQLNLFN